MSAVAVEEYTVIKGMVNWVVGLVLVYSVAYLNYKELQNKDLLQKKKKKTNSLAK